MDGWWDEEEYYPLEDSPDEEEQLLPVESNPFKPISVADRFDQMEPRSFPAAPVEPAPSQPARLAPLAPARSFPQPQQPSPFHYDLPDTPADLPPFGMNTGALSPLGQPTGGMDLSALHQTTQTGPVAIWSIDHPPVQPAPVSGPSAPYPGFPPLPQSKPAQREPGDLTDHHGVNWTLPEYPETDPDWQPPEGEAPEVPEFLKEEEPVKAPEEKKTQEKLNIPAYLRVQPLPKKPRPAPKAEEPAPEQPADKPADSPSAMPFRGDSAEGDQQEDWVGNEVYMRPKPEGEAPTDDTEANYEQLSMEQFLLGMPKEAPKAEPAQGAVSRAPEEAAPSAGKTADEPSPEEEIVPAADAENAAPVAVTSGNRRSRRSRMAAREADVPESVQPEAQPDPQPAVEASQPEATEAAAPVREEPAVAPQPRRRRHHSEAAGDAAKPAPTEEDRPFVPAVGAEDTAADASAARPAQDEPTQPDDVSQPAHETPPQALPFTTAEPVRPSLGSAGQLLPFVRRSPEGTVFAPVADIDSDDDWRPYSEAPTVFTEKPLFSAADSPFGQPQTPIPDALEQEWSPFDGQTTSADVPENAGADSALPMDGAQEEWSLFDGPKAAVGPLLPEASDAPANSATAPLLGEQPLFPVSDPPEASGQEWFLFDEPDIADEPEAAAAPEAHDPPDAPPYEEPASESEADTADPPETPDAPAAPDSSESIVPSDPFTAKQPIPAENPLFPEDSAALFSHGLPPIPDAPQQEWSPYGTLLPDDSDPFPSFEEDFAPTLFGDDLSISADNGRMLPPGGPVAEEPLLPVFEPEEAYAPSFGQEMPFAPSGPQENDLFVDVVPYPNGDSALFASTSYESSLLSTAAEGGLPYQRINNLDAKIRSLGPSPEMGQEKPASEAPTQQWASPRPRGQRAPAPQQQTKPRPPINPVRLALLILAIAMAVFCIVAGCKMLMGYVQNTEDWSKTHADFYNENGVSMNQAGELVSLPEDGSTFAPTTAPVQGDAILSANGQHDADSQAAQPTPKPVLRTRVLQYPNNPLRNPIELISKTREEYPEVVGKLEIPGVIDEWIVQRNNTYYLNHNYRGTSSEGGAVFMDMACTLDTPPENLHLRGRGGVPGKTFNALWQYKTGGMSFIYNAEIAHVTTLYEEMRYILFAIIETSGDPAKADYFNYASHPTFATDEEMMNYVARAREHSLYNLPTVVNPGDRLLTLSTVSSADDPSDQNTNLVLLFSSMP